MNLNINSDAFRRLQDFNTQAEDCNASRRMRLGSDLHGDLSPGINPDNQIARISCNDYDRTENQKIRQTFAKALTDAFGVNSLKELPQEVQKDLKIGDFKEKKDGTITSTRPLTARRIVAIMSAVQNYAAKTAPADKTVSAQPLPRTLDSAGVQKAESAAKGTVMSVADKMSFKFVTRNMDRPNQIYNFLQNALEKIETNLKTKETVAPLFDAGNVTKEDFAARNNLTKYAVTTLLGLNKEAVKEIKNMSNSAFATLFDNAVEYDSNNPTGLNLSVALQYLREMK